MPKAGAEAAAAPNAGAEAVGVPKAGPKLVGVPNPPGVPKLPNRDAP